MSFTIPPSWVEAYQKLLDERKTFRDQMGAKEQEITNLKRQVSETLHSVSVEKRHHRQEIERAGRMEADLNEMTVKCHQREEESMQLQAAKEELERHVADLTEEVTDLNDVKVTVDRMKEEKRSLAEKLEVAEKTIEELRSEKVEADTDKRRWEGRASKLDTELNTAELELVRLRRLKDRKDSLEKEAGAAKEWSDNLIKVLGDTRAKNEHLEMMIRHANGSIETLNEQLNAYRRDLEKERADYADLQQEMARKIEEVKHSFWNVQVNSREKGRTIRELRLEIQKLEAKAQEAVAYHQKAYDDVVASCQQEVSDLEEALRHEKETVIKLKVALRKRIEVARESARARSQSVDRTRAGTPGSGRMRMTGEDLLEEKESPVRYQSPLEKKCRKRSYLRPRLDLESVGTPPRWKYSFKGEEDATRSPSPPRDKSRSSPSDSERVDQAHPDHSQHGRRSPLHHSFGHRTAGMHSPSL